MGNYSFLIGHTHADQCLVNWDAVDPTKIRGDWRLEDLYKRPADERPKTLADVAGCWHETKFFGYFNEGVIEAMYELSRNLVSSGQNPRLFYRDEYNEDQVICIEFVPGSDVVNCTVQTVTPGEDAYTCAVNPEWWWKLDPIYFYS